VFNYFNPTNLPERYWGIEIRFEPELDEVFGVTNNKQNVRGIELLDKEEEENYHEDLFKSDYKLQLRRILSQDIVDLQKGMMKEINNMAPKDEGTTANNWKTPGLEASKKASELLKGDPAKTGTKIDAESKSDVEIQKEREAIIRSNDPSLSDVEIKEAAKNLEQLDVFIAFGNWPGSGFMTIKGAGETAVVQLNRDHPFYTDLYMKIANDENSPEAIAMNLLLLAYVRAENEMYNDKDTLEEMREKWGAQLKKFLNENRKM